MRAMTLYDLNLFDAHRKKKNTFRSSEPKRRLTLRRMTRRTASENKVQFQLQKEEEPSREADRIMIAKEECQHLINYHQDYMQEIVVSKTLRTSFLIFPRTTEEFRNWQADSIASSFPHNEPRLGDDYCWLTNLEQ